MRSSKKKSSGSRRGGSGRGGKGSAGGRGAKANLRKIFSEVDSDGSGEIDAAELQTALSNGTWAPFNEATVRLMMGMFDRDGSGGISFSEFECLWGYITKWVDTFAAYDADASGTIEKKELQGCLEAFGYRLGQPTYRRMIRKFDRSGSGGLQFDDFILLCVQLQSLTELFKDKDTNRTGHISLRYEEFIDMLITSNLI